MTQRDPQPSPFSDPEMHRLFQALREHVVKVLLGFTERVNSRVELLADQPTAEGPEAAEIFADSVVEASNMVVGVLRDVEPAEEEPASTDPQHPSESDREREES